MNKDQINTFTSTVQQIKLAPEKLDNYELVGTWLSLLSAFRDNEAKVVAVSASTKVNTINDLADSLVALYINLVKFGQLIGGNVGAIVNTPTNSILSVDKRDLNIGNLFYSMESYFKNLSGSVMHLAQTGDRSQINLNSTEDKIKQTIALSRFVLEFYGIQGVALIAKSDLIVKQLMTKINE